MFLLETEEGSEKALRVGACSRSPFRAIGRVELWRVAWGEVTECPHVASWSCSSCTFPLCPWGAASGHIPEWPVHKHVPLHSSIRREKREDTAGMLWVMPRPRWAAGVIAKGCALAGLCDTALSLAVLTPCEPGAACWHLTAFPKAIQGPLSCSQAVILRVELSCTGVCCCFSLWQHKEA